MPWKISLTEVSSKTAEMAWAMIGATDNTVMLSVAPIIAQAISAVFEDTSVSEIFQGNHLA